MAAHEAAASGTSTADTSASSPSADWLATLNDAQREAATWGDARSDGLGVDAGPLLIIAGAGTGKTATLAHRVAHLVLSGVPAPRILLLTFTRRAAAEMLRRAERIVAQARPGMPVRLDWSGTFHAIGARILRQHAERVGLDPAFGILDRGDASDLMDLMRHQHGLSSTEKRFPRKDTCLAIYSHCVNTGHDLQRVLDEVFPWCGEWHQPLRDLFAAYVERKIGDHVLDYDDLLLWWQAAMEDEDFAAEIGGQFDHVLVDEYQDTNALQWKILKSMKPDGKGLGVVGDDAQSIYAFRAADVDNILNFPEQFDPPARRIALEINYRSVQPVLDTANALISEARRRHPKTLRAHRGGGAKPRLVTVLDDQAQARFVIDEILRQREDGVPLRRQAVLFRSSHHSDLLEVELIRRNIPFVKYGGLKFLESTHIKDTLSVLRWASNAFHGVAAFRALQLLPGIGPAAAQRVLDELRAAQGAWAVLQQFRAPSAAQSNWPDFSSLMSALASPEAAWQGQLQRVRDWYAPLMEQRFDDCAVRLADLDMLATVATQFADRERFLTELTLDPPSASGDLSGPPLRDEDWLTLSTVHSAKGQEWNAVHVLNVADGNFPNEFQTGSDAGIEEERRLLYVAMTRARDTLCLVEPQRYYVTKQQRNGDRYVHGARSRFLSRAVLRTLDSETPGSGSGASVGAVSAKASKPRIDVASRLRGRF